MNKDQLLDAAEALQEVTIDAAEMEQLRGIFTSGLWLKVMGAVVLHYKNRSKSLTKPDFEPNARERTLVLQGELRGMLQTLDLILELGADNDTCDHNALVPQRWGAEWIGTRGYGDPLPWHGCPSLRRGRCGRGAGARQ